MNSLYRVVIRRDLANPRGYRVEQCYSVSSNTPAPVVWSRARYSSRLFLLSPVPRRPGTVCNPRAILAEYQAARRGPVDRRREAFTVAVSAAEQEYFAAKAHYEARIASAQRRYLAAVTAAKLNYRGILK